MSGELFVSRFAGRTWFALREDGRTVELRAEKEGDAPQVGRVVKARVTKVVPGLQSAFLDIGQGRDAFLHVADLILPEEEPPEEAASEVPEDEADEEGEPEPDTEAEAEPEEVLPRRWGVPRGAPIQDRLVEGRELIVQIAREALGSKGPRVTCFASLAGRHLVYMPFVRHRGVSRRIQDPEERSRLREILERLPAAPGGFIARTAGRGVGEEALRADAALLVAAWREIQSRAAARSAPAVIHSEPPLFLRLLRDAPAEGLERIVVDGPDEWERAVEYLRAVDPQLASRVQIHPGPAPMFEAHGLDQEVDKALRPRVWLRSGGYVVIEPTEALVSIDVNTGKYLGRGKLEETVLRTNLEAAAEIARQLRLRDLGGIIVVDFIDMDRPESRRQVLEALEASLARDRSRTKVIGLSDLGLVQLTRKRTRRGIGASLTRPCPACLGTGRLKAPETVAAEALEEVRRLLAEMAPEEVRVRAHPEIARELRRILQEDGGGLETGSPVTVEEDPAAAPDRYDVVMRGIPA